MLDGRTVSLYGSVPGPIQALRGSTLAFKPVPLIKGGQPQQRRALETIAGLRNRLSRKP